MHQGETRDTSRKTSAAGDRRFSAGRVALAAGFASGTDATGISDAPELAADGCTAPVSVDDGPTVRRASRAHASVDVAIGTAEY